MACATTSWDPEKAIPPQNGKTILITGGSNGPGRQSAMELAKHNPVEIRIAARSESRAEAVVADIKKAAPLVSAKFVQRDLASLESVRQAAAAVSSSAARLDILLLNAGVMDVPAGSVTEDGHEKTFGTNHVGHALLVKLLPPPSLLRKTAEAGDVRVVFVSSVAHNIGPRGGLQFPSFRPQGGGGGEEPTAACPRAPCKGRASSRTYCTREMARRFSMWTTVAAHPGTVKTDLGRDGGGSFMTKAIRAVVGPFIGVEVEDGAKSQLWASTADGVKSGEYYVPVGVPGKGSTLSEDRALAKRLWEWTEGELEGIEI